MLFTFLMTKSVRKSPSRYSQKAYFVIQMITNASILEISVISDAMTCIGI